MKGNAFAILDTSTGILAINSVAYSPREVRRQAVQTEREYLLKDERSRTDQQIWKRLYGYGWRVVPVTVALTRPQHSTGDQK